MDSFITTSLIFSYFEIEVKKIQHLEKTLKYNQLTRGDLTLLTSGEEK